MFVVSLLYYLVEWVRSVAFYFLPPNLEMFDSAFEIVAEQSNLSIDKVVDPSLYCLLYILLLGSLCDSVLPLFPFGEFSPCCSSLFIH